MLFPPTYSEERTADIYRDLVLSLEFSVPDHFSMDRFALRDAGLFSGYLRFVVPIPATALFSLPSLSRLPFFPFVLPPSEILSFTPLDFIRLFEFFSFCLNVVWSLLYSFKS